MFKGSIVAIITPFKEDNSINFEKFEELLFWHLKQGSDGIVVCGTTGENTTISDQEKLELFKVAVKIINHRIPVIANCGSNDTMHSLYLSKQAKEIGVDGLLLINPYYNKCNMEGMYQHFAVVAKNVDLPIVLYNVPSRTNVVIPIEVINRLIKDFKNIVAIKDAGGNLNYSKELLANKNITLLSGDDNSTYQLMTLGAKGVISVVANILPKEYAKMCHLLLENKFEEAKQIHDKYFDFITKLGLEVNPIPIKEAMNLKGHMVGSFRLPLTNMSEENKKILEKAVKEI